MKKRTFDGTGREVHEAVTVIIPGASCPDQAARNAGRHEQLAGFYREHVAAHIRGPY